MNDYDRGFYQCLVISSIMNFIVGICMNHFYTIPRAQNMGAIALYKGELVVTEPPNKELVVTKIK